LILHNGNGEIIQNPLILHNGRCFEETQGNGEVIQNPLILHNGNGEIEVLTLLWIQKLRFCIKEMGK